MSQIFIKTINNLKSPFKLNYLILEISKTNPFGKINHALIVCNLESLVELNFLTKLSSIEYKLNKLIPVSAVPIAIGM